VNMAGLASDRDALAKVLIVLERLPLIIFPLVLMANVMQLAAYPYWDGTYLSRLIMALFLILTSFYPICYFVCLLLVFRKKGKHKLWISIIPAVHLLLVSVLFALA